MAVSIDTVYQRVLAIVNKEQRGYITPLEFNLLANQAQMEIFEQYFYDLDQCKRRPTDDGTMSDTIELITENIIKQHAERILTNDFKGIVEENSIFQQEIFVSPGTSELELVMLRAKAEGNVEIISPLSRALIQSAPLIT